MAKGNRHIDSEAGRGRFRYRQPTSYQSSICFAKGERLVQRRARNHLRNFDTQVRSQFGFCVGDSIIHQLMRLVEYHERRVSEEHTVGCFFNVEKSFDSVWYKGLLHKLREVELPDYLHLIASFQIEKTFCVRLDYSVFPRDEPLLSSLKKVFSGASCSQFTSTTTRDSLEYR